jgi:hypothetical protein
MAPSRSRQRINSGYVSGRMLRCNRYLSWRWLRCKSCRTRSTPFLWASGFPALKSPTRPAPPARSRYRPVTGSTATPSSHTQKKAPRRARPGDTRRSSRIIEWCAFGALFREEFPGWPDPPGPREQPRPEAGAGRPLFRHPSWSGVIRICRRCALQAPQ